LFVVAIATDAPTSAKLAVEIAGRIEQDGVVNANYWVASAPGGSAIQDFVNQCATDPASTAGALIVYNANSQMGTWNFLIYSRQFAQLNLDALLVSCTSDKDHPNGRAEVQWVGHDIQGWGNQKTATLFPIVAVATAVYSFLQQQTTSTQMTYPAPTPVATGPYISQTMQSHTGVSATNLFASGALIASNGFSNAGSSALTLPGIIPDKILKLAAQDIAGKILLRLSSSWSTCPACQRLFTFSPQPAPSNTPTPFKPSPLPYRPDDVNASASTTP